jgi:hypothetical protein
MKYDIGPELSAIVKKMADISAELLDLQLKVKNSGSCDTTIEFVGREYNNAYYYIHGILNDLIEDTSNDKNKEGEVPWYLR